MTKDPSIEIVPFQDLLLLGESERNSLFNELDKSHSGNSTHVYNHKVFRDTDLKFVAYQPGGTQSRWLVASWTLGSTSMQILTGSFLHEGTITKIALRTCAGVPMVVTGRVVWCEHVRAQVHLVLLKFDKDIDLTPILSSKSA